MNKRSETKDKLIAVGSFVCPGIILLSLIVLGVLPLMVDLEAEVPESLRLLVGGAMLLMFLSVIGTWILIVYDFIHVIGNTAFSNGEKIAWLLALWLLNIFAIPVYWVKHLKR